MKPLLSFALPMVLAGLLVSAAAAQSDTTPSPSSTNQATSPSSSSSTQSNSQNSTATQANPATSSTMSQSGTSITSQPSLEGCVIRHESDYFLQPDTGQPVKLDSSEDLSQHLGHRVRVEGNVNHANSNGAYSSGAGSNTQSAAGSSQEGNQPSSTSTHYQEIKVTKIDMISETCPSRMQNQSVPNNSQSPK